MTWMRQPLWQGIALFSFSAHGILAKHSRSVLTGLTLTTFERSTSMCLSDDFSLRDRSFAFLPVNGTSGSAVNSIARRHTQDDRSLPLSLRNLPIRTEQSILFFCGNQAEPVPLVKANGPLRSGPGADQ